MSTTVTLTMAQASSGGMHNTPCPSCGGDLNDAQRQIEDLKAQVRLLNQKAASAGSFVFLIAFKLRLTIGLSG